MLILSNALSDRPDEGSLKVASCLTKRLKEAHLEVTVLSYERTCALTDIHLRLNKLLLNVSLFRLLLERKEPVLYLPFPTRSLPMAARVFLLSHVCPETVAAVLPLTRPHGTMSRFLLKYSRARIVVLSRQAAQYYGKMVGNSRVLHLKTGVDVRQFCHVSSEKKAELRGKYGLDPTKKVLLHVGHLKEGRNLRALLGVPGDWQVLLAVSSFTKQEKDLRSTLEAAGNITILDTFLPNPEELYQLSDAYLFPVQEACNSIDAPLSCLEAAACGLPVITTAHGEMASLLGHPGFFWLEGALHQLLERVKGCKDESREAVLLYHWEKGAETLWQMLQ